MDSIGTAVLEMVPQVNNMTFAGVVGRSIQQSFKYPNFLTVGR